LFDLADEWGTGYLPGLNAGTPKLPAGKLRLAFGILLSVILADRERRKLREVRAVEGGMMCPTVLVRVSACADTNPSETSMILLMARRSVTTDAEASEIVFPTDLSRVTLLPATA